MTVKEKLKMDKPDTTTGEMENVHALFCPDDYGYLDRPDNCPLNRKPIMPSCAQICIDCWNREIPETRGDAIRLSREEVTELYSIVEKALETKREEKEKTMTGCKETQCTSCIHREVCALKADFLEACSAVSGFTYTREKDGSIVRLSDIPFIYPIELQCKYYDVVTMNATKRG